MIKIHFKLMLSMFIATFATRVVAFEALEYFSPIMDAANFEKNTDISVEADSVLVDGAITSYPPDQTTYDRTLMNILRIIQNIEFNPKVALRYVLEARYFIHKIHEEEEPRRILNEEWAEGRPSLDLTYRMAGNLEIFGGAKYWFIPEYERTTESVSFNETSTYGQVGLLIPRAGLLKRGGSFTGGVYYQAGEEEERDVVKKASDGSQIEAQQIVYSPVEFGIFSRMNVSSYVIDLEMTAVQASEGGPKAGENGTSIYEDYIRGRLGVFVPVDKANLNFHFGLVHKTLSYSDNAYMSLETIPLTSLHMKMINGSLDKHVYLGLVYGYGEDTQSLPEFNQKFVINAYGGKAGFVYRF